MYPFNQIVATTKKSPGQNKIKGIVLHHTAGGTFAGNMNYLSARHPDPLHRKNKVSVHFVIGPSEERGKIGDPKDILRHAGNGSWLDCLNVNTDFLGIEVVGSGEPNLHQYIALTDLVEYLMGIFNIPREMIIRHSDCTQTREFTRQGILRDGKRKVKKWDLGPQFFPEGFEVWRSRLIPRKQSRYGVANVEVGSV